MKFYSKYQIGDRVWWANKLSHFVSQRVVEGIHRSIDDKSTEEEYDLECRGDDWITPDEIARSRDKAIGILNGIAPRNRFLYFLVSSNFELKQKVLVRSKDDRNYFYRTISGIAVSKKNLCRQISITYCFYNPEDADDNYDAELGWVEEDKIIALDEQ